jgi:hypothetical protein
VGLPIGLSSRLTVGVRVSGRVGFGSELSLNSDQSYIFDSSTITFT